MPDEAKCEHCPAPAIAFVRWRLSDTLGEAVGINDRLSLRVHPYCQRHKNLNCATLDKEVGYDEYATWLLAGDLK